MTEKRLTTQINREMGNSAEAIKAAKAALNGASIEQAKDYLTQAEEHQKSALTYLVQLLGIMSRI